MKSENLTNFSLATSWDNQLVDNLAALNRQHPNNKVREVFGSFKSSVVGCGRPSYRLPEVSVDQARQHIGLLHQAGIEFNYTLNAPDFSGQENSQDWLTKTLKLLTTLQDIGVDVLTISHPALIQLVGQYFSNFNITVSLIAAVDTVEKAKRFEDMGVATIVLNPHTINRRLDVIEQICSQVACQIELYCNIPCLDHCPKAAAHYAYLGHLSQTGNQHEGKSVDPYLAWCSTVYLTKPVELIKSPFIRPEDVGAYKDLGVSIFKLSDRGESTSWLTSTLAAYMAGGYDGDLFTLIFRDGKKFRVGISKISPEVLEQEIAISISNQALSEMNFIEQIRSLPTAELADFYEAVTQRAVVVGNNDMLRHCLKSGRV